MDIMTLDALYVPKDLIQGYSTAIWTERYSSPGEFSIVTSLIEETMALAPLMTLITHVDTTEIMIVEDHKIDKDEKGIPRLTISGRSFVSFLENRICARNWNVKWVSNGDNTGEVIIGIIKPQVESGYLAPFAGGDVIPNLTVQMTAAVTAEDEGADAQFDIPIGQLLPAVTGLLDSSGLGIQTIRPGTLGTNYMVLQVYRGLDRTAGQSVRPKIILTTASGDYRDASYLWSVRGLKNVAYVMGGDAGAVGVFKTGTDNSTAALLRRDMYVDATDVEIKEGVTAPGLMAKRGLVELKKAENSYSAIVDGSVSPNIAYVFRKDYALGDFITIQADYGVNATMMVSEYIRSQDKSGDVGYPTLVVPT